MAQTVETRGSQKMLQQLFSRSAEPSAEEVKQALGAQQVRYDILWWWWRGQPALEEFFAEILVEREQAGNLVQDLINQGLNIQVNAVGARSKQLAMRITNSPIEGSLN